jgi:hypothetical protein
MQLKLPSLKKMEAFFIGEEINSHILRFEYSKFFTQYSHSLPGCFWENNGPARKKINQELHFPQSQFLMYSLLYHRLLTVCLFIGSLSAYCQSESALQVYSTDNPLLFSKIPDAEVYYSQDREGIYFTLADYQAGKPNVMGAYLRADHHSVTFMSGGERIYCPAKRVCAYTTTHPKSSLQKSTYMLVKGEFWKVEQEGAIWVFSQASEVHGQGESTCFLMTKNPRSGKYASITPYTVAGMIKDQPALYQEYLKLSLRKKTTRARWFLEKYNHLSFQLLSSPQFVQRTLPN